MTVNALPIIIGALAIYAIAILFIIVMAWQDDCGK
jgi:hypothetical protein